MIVDDILDAVVTKVEALGVTSDSGAPAAFHEVDYLDLDESTEDRGFAVYISESDPDGQRDVTSSDGGSGDYFIRFVVEVKYFNEGRSRRAFDSIVAQDRRRMIDVIPSYLRNNVPNVGECMHEGGRLQTEEQGAAVYSILNFRAEYRDTTETG